MQRRSGMTLVEVLVAIFVMGIGMIALLTLFPIGMLRMARAIHDERSAQSAQNAHAAAVIYSLGQDLDVATDQAGTYNGGVGHDVFINPSPRHPVTGVANYLLNADPYAESYPIFVDPIGYYNVSGAAQHWVGGFVPASNVNVATAPHAGGLRRRPAEFVRNGLVLPAQNIQRNLRIYNAFTLWDDLIFENDVTVGSPGGPKINATTVLRDPRFSWAYTMQRPMASEKSVVNCSIVVFDKRSLSISGNGALAEEVYQNMTYFNPLTNTITITNLAGAVPPSGRPGDWIMDITPVNPTANTGSAHAYWYRIVSVEVLGPTATRFEVQQPIRGRFAGPMVTDATGTITYGFQGTCVMLDGVAEVFEKGPIRLP